jgi:D-serine deaminase-like pyridoxal phosphate-dependent protein
MLDTIPTPALLLDRPKFQRNVARLKERLGRLGVPLRPHMKTAKSVDILRLMDPDAITVSTLKEAEVFAAAGVRDILYAVGLAPGKIGRVRALRAGGVELMVVVDSVEAAQALAASAGEPVPALIEVDTDGHRAGRGPEDRDGWWRSGAALAAGSGSALGGVMTHAGRELRSVRRGRACEAAERERAGRGCGGRDAAGGGPAPARGQRRIDTDRPCGAQPRRRHGVRAGRLHVRRPGSGGSGVIGVETSRCRCSRA